jgi:hypothetical protein
MGINLKAVQLIMGDNTTNMVMRVYANLDKTDVLKGSESYAKVLTLLSKSAHKKQLGQIVRVAY